MSKLVCPGCGGLCRRADLSPSGGCPLCNYESPATIAAMLADDTQEYDEVNMVAFLPRVLAWAERRARRKREGSKP